MGHPVFSRQSAPLGAESFPHIRGGNSSSKGFPALPIPRYPALCREDTSSWNDGRPRTQYEPQRAERALETHRAARGSQESPGEPRGAQGSPGQPRTAQERGAQENPGEPRKPLVSPGELRRAQENPGEPRRAQESTGERQTIRNNTWSRGRNHNRLCSTPMLLEGAKGRVWVTTTTGPRRC